MKKIIWALMVLLITACSEDSPDIPEDNPDPVQTLVGTPVGEEITKTIGPEGGTANSADGKMELVFPEGALTGNTDVTIQAITNNIPGGRGNVYRIGPGGTTLNIPATIKLHYTEKDIEGSLAILLGMAFQEPDGIWYSIPDRSIDTLNRTISISTVKLFTADSPSKSSGTKSAPGTRDWGTFADLYILPSSKVLRVNESSEFKVVVVIRPEAMSGSGNEDDLPALPEAYEVSQRTVRSWIVNDTVNPKFGTIVPDGSHCIYTAPGTAPESSRNPVQLSANLANLVYRNPVTGRDMTSLTLVAPVKILDDNYNFRLRLASRFESLAQALFTWTLTDNAIITLQVRNGFVTVTDTHNETGSVSPTSQSTPYGDGECVATWIDEVDATGYLNVDTVYGETGPYGFNQEIRSLMLTVKHKDTRLPKFRMVCGTNEPAIYGGEPWGILERTYSFILTDSTQTVPSLDTYLTVTLEPILDK